MPPPQQLIPNVGAKLWGELHLWALSENPTLDFLLDFEYRVGKELSRCQCLKEWKRIKAERPPQGISDLFEWSVWIHNRVNQKLGKPQFTLEEARERWQIDMIPSV